MVDGFDLGTVAHSVSISIPSLLSHPRQIVGMTFVLPGRMETFSTTAQSTPSSVLSPFQTSASSFQTRIPNGSALHLSSDALMAQLNSPLKLLSAGDATRLLSWRRRGD